MKHLNESDVASRLYRNSPSSFEAMKILAQIFRGYFMNYIDKTKSGELATTKRQALMDREDTEEAFIELTREDNDES